MNADVFTRKVAEGIAVITLGGVLRISWDFSHDVLTRVTRRLRLLRDRTLGWVLGQPEDVEPPDGIGERSTNHDGPRSTTPGATNGLTGPQAS